MAADKAALLRSSISSASHLIGLQLLSRLLTFALNQALFRMVSPSVFGTASVQFELLLNTILFLSREGVRTSILRGQYSKEVLSKISLLPALFGLPLAFIATVSYYGLASEETRVQPGFANAVGIYAVAACIELWKEPMHNL
jgi:hypothetical protein